MGQVVRRVAVGLQHNEVIHQPVLEVNVAPDQVVQRRGAFQGHLEADHRCYATVVLLLALGVGKVAAVSVVTHCVLAFGLLLADPGQPFDRAVAAICLAAIDELAYHAPVGLQPL